MEQLREIRDPAQIPDEPPRRWFTSEHFDLIVWCDGTGVPSGFQLCYDKKLSEHALTWRAGQGFSHEAVDDGEGRGFSHKGTPILVPDGLFDGPRVLHDFREASTGLPPEIAAFVDSVLQMYPYSRQETP